MKKCLEPQCPCKTLMEHLVKNSTTLNENAATEILAYIINHTPEATDVLSGLIQDCGIPSLDAIDCLHTQASANGKKGLPDLKACSKAGRELFLAEVKFDAPLTKRQKTGYRQSLKPTGPNATLFIVPEHRIERVAQQLSKDLIPVMSQSRQCLTYCLPNEALYLSVTSWNFLLDTLNTTTGPALSEELRYDLKQLSSLVKVKDFRQIPLPSVEDLPYGQPSHRVKDDKFRRQSRAGHPRRAAIPPIDQIPLFRSKGAQP